MHEPAPPVMCTVTLTVHALVAQDVTMRPDNVERADVDVRIAERGVVAVAEAWALTEDRLRRRPPSTRGRRATHRQVRGHGPDRPSKNFSLAADFRRMSPLIGAPPTQ